MQLRFFLLLPLLALTVGFTSSDPKPVRIFLLLGQSNMQGHGMIEADPERNGGQGSLEHVVRTSKRFAALADADGEWVVRDDAWISYLGRQGGLTAGYGAREEMIGPELGFGHVVGEHFDEPVLLIKVAWGGKSLAADFRPPSREGVTGPYYTKVVKEVRRILECPEAFVPGYAERGYELAGVGWHQGWNDRINQAFNDEYEENLAALIRDLRKELAVPELPFVIAETGMTGPDEKHPRALSLMRAQAAVAERKEFRGTVAFVGTRDFYRPPEESPSQQGYHWNSNAETYLLIGEGMGQAMLELLDR